MGEGEKIVVCVLLALATPIIIAVWMWLIKEIDDCYFDGRLHRKIDEWNRSKEGEDDD
ncbi:hypothetical protein [Selenomonas sp. AB3002]|uniref:hypothetical protein n=1 Tax=Selenomonas sp. AB3002 TaxID=1392502 RepID=UPI00163B2BED